MFRALPFLLLLCAATATAEPVVTEMRQFPTGITAVEAADGGVLLLSNTAKLWFVDEQGRARTIPSPVRGRIHDIRYGPSGGLLWGCTSQDLFATNPGGGWVSWELADAEAASQIRSCRVVPGPGNTTWVVQERTTPRGYVTVVLGVDARGQDTEVFEVPGVRVRDVASDGAGGLWAGLDRGGSGAVAHFDGAHWQVWASRRLQFADAFVDVYPLDAPTVIHRLWGDGRGGAFGVQIDPLAIVTLGSTAPYPRVSRAGIGCPRKGCSLRGYAYDGLLHVVAAYDEQERAELASFDETGTLVGLEPIPLPDWKERLGSRVQHSIRDGVHWIADDQLLLRRGPERWSAYASSQVVERERGRGREKATEALLTGLWLLPPAMVVAIPPAMYDEEFGVPYPRPAFESLLTTVVAYPGHLVLGNGAPWRETSALRSAMSVFFGSVLSVGFATVATVTTEVFFQEEGEPFPVDGAVLGAAGGLVTGALLDWILSAADIGTFRRTALWSSFTAAGAPLGFHAFRSRRE